MSKAIFLLGILFTIIIGTFLQYMFCCEDATEPTVMAKPAVIKEPIPKRAVNPFVLKDSLGDFKYAAKEEHINFNKSEAKIITPITTEVSTGILKIIRYLNDHSDKYIDISGYYGADENYTGALPNLGIARATAVKNYMVEKGVLSKQINLFGKLKEHLLEEENILLGPLEISIKTNNKEEEAIANSKLISLAENIKKNPIVLYFETNQVHISLTAAQRQKLVDIATYLDKVENAKCLVVGHTDSRGRLKKNIELGQDRADFVKNYLIDNGISTNDIEASSMGPKKPIANNKTKKGQAKNRRTVITLK